ncbi:MAG: SxtJ family membrane protein [Acidobacteriota bacterium]
MDRVGPAEKTRSENRRFGIVVGGVFCVLGGLLLGWRHRLMSGTAFLVIGGMLVLLALAWPDSLTLPHRLWRRFALVLGRINTALILSLAYYLILTPVGLFFRLVRRDELRRRRVPDAGTTWVPYTGRVSERNHFERMF